MKSSQPTSGHQQAGQVARARQADCVQRRRLHGHCSGCLVRELAPCSAIPPEDTHALEESGGQVRLAPGGVLAREGDPRTEVHTVTSGMMRRTRLLPDGRRFVYAFVLPGDFIGFSSASSYRHTVEAVTGSTLCSFSVASVRGLCDRYPEFETSLLREACGELDDAGSYLMALARMTPIERLAAFLVDLSGRQHRRGGTQHHVELPMTRADIADHLGLTIETVSRSFTRLKQEGALYFEHPHHIELRDPGRLRAMAGL
ncbi:MAG: Crp/Fnr family transcriptional regulator [Luteimonas sp.]